MYKKLCLFMTAMLPMLVSAQTENMTPELMWRLGRVGFMSVSPDNQKVLYSVRKYNLKTEKSSTTYRLYNLNGDKNVKVGFLKGYSFVQWDNNGLYATKDNALYISQDEGVSWQLLSDNLKDANNLIISADGSWLAFSKEVKIERLLGKDLYQDLPKTSAKVYEDLNYRHWDTYRDGNVSHIFIRNLKNNSTTDKDIMPGEPYDAPQKPFGGSEDFIFSPDGQKLIYVCKKKVGKEYAKSTNTDLFAYDLSTGLTENLTKGMMGYDVSPKFDKTGRYLAWLSMKRDGYEADKNDIVIMDFVTRDKVNLTATADETVDGGFIWGDDGKTIYYNAAYNGTMQLNKIDLKIGDKGVNYKNRRVTYGKYDVAGVLAQIGDKILINRTDFNHALELFLVHKDGTMRQASKVNNKIYDNVKMSRSELRMMTTVDGKEMGVWVIYPPDFDPNKKYPTLLYCQGGPQGALSQFYSFRWNFQVMAAKGYIVVAPNRRGMPGWGVKWNEEISKEWGGLVMQDYLTAIDEMSKEPFVDRQRLGCIGASYGGYSVFMLAGIHEGRFKTFISHCGLFDMRSWYGTTEELWFANWDLGGPYWTTNPPKGYSAYNPSNYINKWNTPIMIIQGEKDYRVSIEQGLQAFQAAQLRGIKSKLILFPDENHWIMKPQNSILWHREFYKWLDETL